MFRPFFHTLEACFATSVPLASPAKRPGLPLRRQGRVDAVGVRAPFPRMEQQTDFQEELHRVIIHGVLHLCGINDKGPGERAIMEAAENKALALLPHIFEL